MKKITLGYIVLALSYMSATFANEQVSKATAISKNPDAKAYIITPNNAQIVQQTFKVQFGLAGMGVAPAGVKKAKTGHHHLLIDTDIKSINLSKPLPATDKIKHFGGGQTETTLQLPPGKHTLQLLLGNYMHIPHDQAVVSEQITITVQ